MTTSTVNSIQELSLKNDEDLSPENFIYKGSYGIPDGNVPLIDVPVIDVGQLLDPPSTQQLHNLRSALSSYGCFQVINHGMTSSFLDKVRNVSKQFFALPTEEKQRYSREADSIEGYGNDMVLFNNQSVDWTDRLYLTLSPEDQHQPKFWPRNPEAFRESLQYYGSNVQELNKILLKAMARSLDLEENSFLDQYGERALVTSRFNFYPPCPRPDVILGVKPHADGSALSFLLQDKEVEGLQFLKDEQWFKVPIIPHALLVNAGDQIEIMSNGIFKSPVHRVVTNSQRERNTLAVFCIPDSEIDIGPVDKLISETRPAAYKRIKDFVSLYFQYYQQNKRPIEAVKI